MNVQGKKALVLGLGREGVALARFLASNGAHVVVNDAAGQDRLLPGLQALENANVRTVIGRDDPALVRDADVVFVSPGVSENNVVYTAASDAGLPIESMTTLFFELCPAPIVGITGSSGKTTTTGLIGHLLREARRDVAVGGNIGDPMLDLLPTIGRDTIVVLELSSFQLQILRRSPHIALVTNISPNHLDRHGTMEAYVGAKLHIVQHQGTEDFAILNAADPALGEFARAGPAQKRWFGPSVRRGASLEDDMLGLRDGSAFRPVIAKEQVPLLGRHNIENVLGALAVGDVLGVSAEDMARAVRSFRPAPHRLQPVGERCGVRYVDDSIATSPARAQVALESIDSPIVLIAGGRDKRLPWDDFARRVVERVRVLLLIGEAAILIEEVVRGAIRRSPGTLRDDAVIRCSSLEEAVDGARNLARPGDTVLLSPACASYDMFTNFEERGRVFARAVEALDAA